MLASGKTSETVACCRLNHGPLLVKEEKRADNTVQEAEDVRDIFMQGLCAVSEVNSELADNGDEEDSETSEFVNASTELGGDKLDEGVGRAVAYSAKTSEQPSADARMAFEEDVTNTTKKEDRERIAG